MIVKPIISAADAAGRIKEGNTLMIGGFMDCGSPHTIIFAIKEIGTKNLTLICNDTAIHNFKTGTVTGVGHLVQNKMFRKIIASHIGANQETQRQMNTGETEVEEIVEIGEIDPNDVHTPSILVDFIVKAEQLEY